MPRCLSCREKFEPRYFLQKFCEGFGCKIEEQKYQEQKRSGTTIKTAKAIPKFSDKRKVENLKYTAQRIVFLGKKENKICFIDGCGKNATTVEHICGRKGFYDDWARDNNVSLYLDQRFWRPCCHAHNLELENNPELSKEYQLSKIHGGKKL
jgi:hypothetical protein